MTDNLIDINKMNYPKSYAIFKKLNDKGEIKELLKINCEKLNLDINHGFISSINNKIARALKNLPGLQRLYRMMKIGTMIFLRFTSRRKHLERFTKKIPAMFGPIAALIPTPFVDSNKIIRVELFTLNVDIISPSKIQNIIQNIYDVTKEDSVILVSHILRKRVYLFGFDERDKCHLGIPINNFEINENNIKFSITIGDKDIYSINFTPLNLDYELITQLYNLMPKTTGGSIYMGGGLEHDLGKFAEVMGAEATMTEQGVVWTVAVAASLFVNPFLGPVIVYAAMKAEDEVVDRKMTRALGTAYAAAKDKYREFLDLVTGEGVSKEEEEEEGGGRR